MKFKTKLYLCLLKRYFDVGFGLLNYLKYPLILLGFAIPNVKGIIFFSLAYGILCFILGWAWLNSDFYTADTELSNKFNPFVKEVRTKLT